MDGMYDHYCLVTWEFIPDQYNIIFNHIPSDYQCGTIYNIVRPGTFLIGENVTGHVTPPDCVELDGCTLQPMCDI